MPRTDDNEIQKLKQENSNLKIEIEKLKDVIALHSNLSREERSEIVCPSGSKIVEYLGNHSRPAMIPPLTYRYYKCEKSFQLSDWDRKRFSNS